MLIAVQIFFGTELALSVTCGATSPKGRGFSYSYRGKALVRARTWAEMSSFFSS